MKEHAPDSNERWLKTPSATNTPDELQRATAPNLPAIINSLSANSAPLRPNDILYLQRTIGNHAVQRLLESRDAGRSEQDAQANANSDTATNDIVQCSPDSVEEPAQGDPAIRRVAAPQLSRVQRKGVIQRLPELKQALRSFVKSFGAKGSKMKSRITGKGKKQQTIPKQSEDNLELEQSEEIREQSQDIQEQNKASTTSPSTNTISTNIKPKPDLRNTTGVMHGDPPLTADSAHKLLSRIVSGDNSALDELRGDTSKLQNLKNKGKDLRSIEWGIGKEKTSDEYFLFVGSSDGVDISDFKEQIDFMAHAHPYWENPSAPGGMDKVTGKISVNTKEIAGEATDWDKMTVGTGNWETLRIFPSAADVVVCALRGIKRHSVYTPYGVTDSDPPQIVNPRDQHQDLPRLVFDILDAQKTGRIFYRATLVAKAGDEEFWRNEIDVTSMPGPDVPGGGITEFL